MRPIDADALQFKPCVLSDDVGFSVGCVAIRKSEIDAAPTLDYAPVRHGEWIFVEAMEGEYETEIAERCSVCGRFAYRYQGTPQDNYCPNCGAKMDGGKKDG